jgi:myo-inositol-1(or 4)-monophosphatase
VTTPGPDLDLACQVAIEAAEAAGVLLRAGTRRAVAGRAKGAAGDVVTDLDVAAEDLIVGRLRAVFPGHRIIAEEAGLLEPDGAAGTGQAGCTWLVDPLDGTNNVVVGLAAYAVGIALATGGLPVVGVVHDPVAAATWSAVRGQGARGPGGRMPTPACRAAPHGPVLAWTQGHGVSRQDPTARSLKLVLESAARRVLQLWAPLLSWVMLARGDIDGIVGYRPELVDLPAGALIAAESGIVIRGLDGGPFDVQLGQPDADRSFVAGHPANISRLTRLAAAAATVAPQVAGLRAGGRW